MDKLWTLGEEVNRRMGELGLSAKRLSLAAGLNETYVRDIMRGRTRNPRTDSLGKLARALGCARADLLPPRERLAEGGDGSAGRLEPAVLNRALAVAERLAGEDKILASEIASVAYRLLRREQAGQAITDDEGTLRILEEFARRVHSADAISW